MNARRVLRGLRTKTAALSLLAVSVVALGLPATAAATPATPVIDSPASGAVVGAGSRTIAFTDASPASYALLRFGPVVGACAPVPDISATVVATAPDDTVDLVDSAPLASGDWCYWVEGDDGLLVPADSAALQITIDVTPPAAATGVTLVGSTPRRTAPSFTFTETGDPGDTYQLYQAGVAVGSPVPGSPIADPTSVPADGTYSYTIKTIDSVGNESTTSSAVNVRFDNTAPAAPASFARSGPNPRTTAPSFTFSSSSDLSGPVTYQLYRDGVAVGTPDSGSPIADPGVPADGAHDYTVTAIDALGNEGTAAGPLQVTMDNSGPPKPANAALVGSTPRTNAASITFDASTDPSGPVTYQLFRGATPVGAASTSTTLADPSVPADGTYSYTVVATDNLGNDSVPSDAVSVRYDNTDPTVPANLALQGATPRTTAASFTFDASTDASGPITYQLKRGATLLGTPSAGTTLADPSVPADGTYTYTVVAIDALGNTSTASGGVSVRYDNSGPSTPSSLSLVGSTPRKTAASFTFGASIDATGPVTYELVRDTTPVVTLAPSSPLADPSVPSDGTYSYTVRATDALGNTSTASNAVSVTFDNTAPATPTTFALTGVNPRKTAPVFSFDSVIDASGTVTYKLLRDSAMAATSTSTTMTDSPVPADGTYVYTVVAVDPLGNASAPSSDISVRIDNTGPTTPVAARVGSSPTNTAPAITFPASTDASGPITYQLYRDASPVGSPQMSTTLTDSPIPSDGTHAYTVRAIDGLGNQSSLSNSVSFSVDASAPSPAPTGLTLTGGNPRHDPPQFFYSTSSDPNGVTYRLYRDGNLTTRTSTTSSITDDIALDGSADGTYSYTVKAIDGLGNETAATNAVSVTIDAGPPSVPGNLRTPAALTRTTPVISWNASSGTPAVYKVLRDGSPIGTVIAPITTFSDPRPLDGSGDGTYTYRVVAIDALNNESAPSAPLEIKLDTTRPAPSISLAVTQNPTAAKPVLAWSASASNDIAGYNVYRGTAKVNGALVATTSFTDSGLTGDGTFTYTVRGVDKAGNESTDSISTSVLYDTSAPATPGASALAASGGGTSTVSWSASADAGSGVAGYQVRRSAANGGAPTSLAEGTPVCGLLPPSALACGDAGLAPGTTFRYSVFAIDAVGNVSAAGQTALITIPSTEDRTPPKAPTSLHASVANGQIRLTWRNPKADLANVAVILNAKRAPRSAGDGSTVYRGVGTRVTVKVPKLSPGKLVRFAVFALDRSGNASVAARATVVVPRPSSVSLAPNGKLSGSPNLTWNAVTGATYYNVQVFEGTQASKRVGISWPAVTRWTLPGKLMKKGKVYTWYVWPGIGAKSAAKYGKLIGKVTFTYSG
jgi:large repetitive protein